MPSAEIIAIGTELLLGEIQDTNTAAIAKALNTAGVDVFRTVIIGDNSSRIAEEIRGAIKRADIIITTGGLGPTVDDPTRLAVAEAFNAKLEFIPELWDEIINRFQAYGKTPTENNRRQAYIPAGANAIRNPVGTAPSFYIKQGDKIVFCLPGVPFEMLTILHDSVIPHIIIEDFNIKGTIFSRIIHTAGLGESAIDALIDELESGANPTVGLAAHPGQVDIRITAKAADQIEADRLIAPIETRLKSLLGQYIYGSDGTTLWEVVEQSAIQHNIQFIIKGDHSTIDQFIKPSRLSNFCPPTDAKISPHSMYNDDSRNIIISLTHLNIQPFKMQMKINFRNQVSYHILRYGGHPVLVSEWLENQVLYTIWQLLKQSKNGER